MIFLGKNACNRIIFITFAVKCISSTRRFAETPSEFSLLREDLQELHLSSVSYEKICFYTKHKANLRSQKRSHRDSSFCF